MINEKSEREQTTITITRGAKTQSWLKRKKFVDGKDTLNTKAATMKIGCMDRSFLIRLVLLGERDKRNLEKPRWNHR